MVHGVVFWGPFCNKFCPQKSLVFSSQFKIKSLFCLNANFIVSFSYCFYGNLIVLRIDCLTDQSNWCKSRVSLVRIERVNRFPPSPYLR